MNLQDSIIRAVDMSAHLGIYPKSPDAIVLVITAVNPMPMRENSVVAVTTLADVEHSLHILLNKYEEVISNR